MQVWGHSSMARFTLPRALVIERSPGSRDTGDPDNLHPSCPCPTGPEGTLAEGAPDTRRQLGCTRTQANGGPTLPYPEARTLHSEMLCEAQLRKKRTRFSPSQPFLKRGRQAGLRWCMNMA